MFVTGAINVSSISRLNSKIGNRNAGPRAPFGSRYIATKIDHVVGSDRRRTFAGPLPCTSTHSRRSISESVAEAVAGDTSALSATSPRRAIHLARRKQLRARAPCCLGKCYEELARVLGRRPVDQNERTVCRDVKLLQYSVANSLGFQDITSTEETALDTMKGTTSRSVGPKMNLVIAELPDGFSQGTFARESVLLGFHSGGQAIGPLSQPRPRWRLTYDALPSGSRRHSVRHARPGDC